MGAPGGREGPGQILEIDGGGNVPPRDLRRAFPGGLRLRVREILAGGARVNPPPDLPPSRWEERRRRPRAFRPAAPTSARHPTP